MGASSQQGNTSGFRPYMGQNQGYQNHSFNPIAQWAQAQNGGYQGFGQMPNMMANQLRQGFYGNPQYDMQMPWMQQFNQQRFNPVQTWSNMQNQSGITRSPSPSPSYNVGTNTTMGVNPSTGSLAFNDPMGLGVGNSAPAQAPAQASGGGTAGVDPLTGRFTFY